MSFVGKEPRLPPRKGKAPKKGTKAKMAPRKRKRRPASPEPPTSVPATLNPDETRQFFLTKNHKHSLLVDVTTGQAATSETPSRNLSYPYKSIASSVQIDDNGYPDTFMHVTPEPWTVPASVFTGRDQKKTRRTKSEIQHDLDSALTLTVTTLERCCIEEDCPLDKDETPLCTLQDDMSKLKVRRFSSRIHWLAHQQKYHQALTCFRELTEDQITVNRKDRTKGYDHALSMRIAEYGIASSVQLCGYRVQGKTLTKCLNNHVCATHRPKTAECLLCKWKAQKDDDTDQPFMYRKKASGEHKMSKYHKAAVDEYLEFEQGNRPKWTKNLQQTSAVYVRDLVLEKETDMRTFDVDEDCPSSSALPSASTSRSSQRNTRGNN